MKEEAGKKDTNSGLQLGEALATGLQGYRAAWATPLIRFCNF